MLGRARRVERQPHELRRPSRRLDPHALEQHFGERAIHVVAAERAVAARRLDLEDALVEQENRNVERAAAEVVHGEEAVVPFLEPVSEGRRRRLVQEAQHVEPREPARIFRGLALRVVEVSRHRDDGASHAIELVLGVLLQHLQDLRRDFDRRHRFALDLEANHVGLRWVLRLDEFVRPEPPGFRIVRAATHEALHAHDRVARVRRSAPLRVAPDDHIAPLVVAHHRGHEHFEIAIEHRARRPILHVSDERVRRPEVDTDRARRRFRIENFEKGHVPSSRALTSSRKRR